MHIISIFNAFYNPSVELSLDDRVILEDWVDEPMGNDDNLNDGDFADLPDHISGNESESFLRSIVPPYVTGI